jgi:PIN domain nuclease of toxin-antitoxin system
VSSPESLAGSRAVVDASALLALLNAEPGADHVAGALPGAVVSAVNLAEVVAKLADAGVPPDEVGEIVAGLGLDVRPFDEALALATGLLRPKTRALDLSLGDRACLALGMHLSLPVVTADRALHADYRTWITEPARAPLPPPEAWRVLDRRVPKQTVAGDVRELLQRNDRRALAFVACAVRGHSVAHFATQMEHYLQSDIGAHTRLKRVTLHLPAERVAFFEALATELRLLGPGRSIADLLRDLAPPLHGPRRVVWLDWGTSGEACPPTVTETQLQEWVRFGAQFLSAQCPADLRLLTSVSLELETAADTAQVLDVLDQARVADWYTHESPAFRLSEPKPLDVVTQTEVLEFLHTQPKCERGLRPELAQLIRRRTRGDFEQTVALLETGQSSSWYALAVQLRGGAGPEDAVPAR